MGFDSVRTIVEGRLVAWAMYNLTLPGGGTAAYDRIVAKTNDTTSDQEKFVASHEETIADNEIIKRAIKRMSKDQRELIWLRYFQHKSWAEIARAIHVSFRAVYSIRDSIIAILAYELNLTSSTFAEDDRNCTDNVQ